MKPCKKPDLGEGRFQRRYRKNQTSRISPSNDVNVLHDEVGFNTIFIFGFEIDKLKYCACSFKNLFTENTVQEPTFERMIVVYR
jgi:hypothetical protein